MNPRLRSMNAHTDAKLELNRFAGLMQATDPHLRQVRCANLTTARML